MPDYQKLYHKTSNMITDVERLLEKAAVKLRNVQRECEEIYIQTDETPPEDEE